MRKAARPKPLSSNLEARSWDTTQTAEPDLDTTAASHETEEVDRYYQTLAAKGRLTRPDPPILRKCGHCRTTLSLDPNTKPGTVFLCFKCGKPLKTNIRVVLEKVTEPAAPETSNI